MPWEANRFQYETAAARACGSWITRLKLTDFRNYDALDLELDARPVVLVGHNGAGKTNLLEAVSLLSPGRGLRGARVDALARQGGPGGWAVAAAIATPGGPVEIGTGIAEAGEGTERGRQVRINREPQRSSQAMLEYLRVLWLTPAMDGLFAGPPADRRRFLDRLVLSLDARHGERVKAFERAMRGRNRLLDEGSPDPRWLAAIETEMAEIAVAIAAARVEAVAMLASMIASASHDGGPFPAAMLALAGTIEEALPQASATEVEDRYRGALAASRRADAAAGRTLAGPHLSDLAVGHAPKAMPAEKCSTGEQKALLIGLVLAHARLTASLSGERPIILLDEIAAHLDAARREALFQSLLAEGAQAWMTGTDEAIFSPFGGAAQFFAVHEGRVTRGGR